ncbi:MAG TPA: hypothetical protein VLT47_10580 [Anaeromyxobacteraceae bacterium]|nr:hypothetical protein [Anaeromyxobacteraceae bacterium]
MDPLRTLALSALLAAGLAAPGGALARRFEAPARQGPWTLELTDESGRALPTFEHRGRIYVLGEPGQRYLLRVRNGSGQRVEVVASVDGLDVTDGKPAAFERRGYLVEPYGEVTIDGYRLSQASVAAFRFGSVARSYAAAKGDARDVGVVGVAVFPERAPIVRRPPPYSPYPYPYPPYYPSPRGSAGGARAEAAPAPSQPAEPLAEGKARAPSSAMRDEAAGRPGLGTEFGEQHGSPVYEVAFERASSRPAAVLTLRYDDRRGLLAAGVDLDRWGWERDDQALREHANPFRAEGPYAEPPPGWRPY